MALAWQHYQAGNSGQAEQLYRQILQANPYHADGLHLLGVLVSQKGRDDLAVSFIERAIAVKPGVAAFHNNLGFSYHALKRWDDAEAEYFQAIQLQPDFAMAHNNLGNVYRSQGNTEKAANCYRQAVQLQPDYPEANGNLGVVLQEQGQREEALACYEQALRLNPDNAETRLNRAMLLLGLGNFAEGWAEFEWRWRTKDMPGYGIKQPRWDGSPLEGRTIFIYAEQGLGDTLQFIRYLQLVKKAGGTVILECQVPLLKLLANFPWIDQLVGRGEPFPAFDFHAPLLSLPGIFQTTLANIPADVPYLQADSKLIEHWRKELNSRSCLAGGTLETTGSGPTRQAGPTDAFKVGISWQGNPGKPFDFHRSIPLTHFARLAQVPGVKLISLQKGPGMDQLAALAEPFPLLDLSPRLDEDSGAFMDTAAVMKNIDLVISSDTAVPHLAGALGVSVWVALPLASDWRWLVGREDCPWYPTMQLFRQAKYGDWDSVFMRIAEELKKAIALRRD
jgi:Flp pilus assembly protein TadD